MSAAAWDLSASPAQAPSRRPDSYAEGGLSRPRLVLVPSPVEPGRLRITPRGRLILFVLGVVVATVLLGVVNRGPVETSESTVTVRAGQTLSEIASTTYPDLPIPNAVAYLRHVNNLSSDQLRAGQRLVLPSTR